MDFRITDRQQEVLDAIQNGTTTTSGLAQQFQVTSSAISSMIKRLEDHGLIQRLDDGGFRLADQQGGQQGNQGGNDQNQGNQGGNQGGGDQGGNGTKIEGARQIFQDMQQEPRKNVLARFMEDLGMTIAGASTYYQRLRGEFGMANQGGNNGGNQGGGQRAMANSGNNRGNQGGNRGGNQGGNRAQGNQGGNNRGGNQGNQGNQGGRSNNRAMANAGKNLPGVPGNTAGRGNQGGNNRSGNQGSNNRTGNLGTRSGGRGR